MAITTLDLALAGFLGREHILKVGTAAEAAGIGHSLFYATGRPGAAAAPSPGVNGAALTTYSGQIPFPAAVALKNIHCAGIEGSCSVAGRLVLCDRLWHNSGLVVTTTTAQAFTPATWPARDLDGATSGRGIMVGIEVSTATTNAGAITNCTMAYTRSSGGAATATMASFPATAVAGTFVPFQLAAGDVGVQTIASVTLGTSMATGAIHIVAYREIASLPISTANVPVALDLISLGMPRMYDSSVPFLVWIPTATTAPTFQGSILYTQG